MADFKVMSDDQREDDQELELEDESGCKLQLEISSDRQPISSPSELKVVAHSVKTNASDTHETAHLASQELMLCEQRNLNAQLHELNSILKNKSSHTPEQSSSKQYATAVHYAKHEKNYYMAAKWFRKAAMVGHARAQFYLAMLFIKGQGVPKSYYHAYSWLSLACCQDLSEAIEARKKLEPHLTSRDIISALRLSAERFEQIQDI